MPPLVLPFLCPKALNGKATRLVHFGSLGMKYFVYVIDKYKEFIAFALSCPDKKTAQRAYNMAVRDTGSDCNGYRSFQSDVIGVDSTVTIAVEPSSNSTGCKTTYKDFGIDDFEDAESDTKKLLSKGAYEGYIGLDRNTPYEKVFAFIRSVNKALKELTGEAILPVLSAPTDTDENGHSVTVDLKRHQNLMSDFLSALNNPGETAPSIIANPLLQKLVSESHSIKNAINSLSHGINKRSEPMNADTAETEPVVDEKPKKKRRSTADRMKAVKQALKLYWTGKVNGQMITQEEAAMQAGFVNEQNILSKKIAEKFMTKLSQMFEGSIAAHGDIQRWDNHTRAAVLTYIHDTLKQ